jgi:hypothetical protein
MTPAQAHWTWIISSAEMLKPDGSLLARGFSGNGPDIDLAASIGKVNHGPLPCGPDGTAGEYTLGPMLPNTDPTQEIHRLGPNICQLIPSDAQRAFIISLGRGPDSFYLHAPKIGEPSFVIQGQPLPTASDGCVCLSEPFRMTVLTSPVRTLWCIPEWPLSGASSVPST